MTKLTFYVGQTGPNGNIVTAEWETIQNALIEGYGGYSLNTVLGGWKDPLSGAVVKEITVVVTVLTEELYDPVKAVRFAQLMKESFQQKEVLFTVEELRGVRV